MGPGSAAHRHRVSKTRVNALMALRSVRGTMLSAAMVIALPNGTVNRIPRSGQNPCEISSFAIPR
jgi:hypothetical protein